MDDVAVSEAGPDELRKAARAAAERGDLEAAAAALTRLGETTRLTAADAAALFDVLTDARRFLAAEAMLRPLVAAEPGSRPLRILLAAAYQRMGRWAACCEVLEATPREPGTPDLATFLLGQGRFWLGMLTEARAAFAVLPADLGAYWNSERLNCAAAAERAERLADDAAAPWHERLRALAGLDRREAFDTLLDALEPSLRTSPEALAARALFALRAGGAAAAAALYAEHASEAMPAGARVGWAKHLTDCGRFAEAETVLRAIPEEARPIETWIALARLFALTGAAGSEGAFAEAFLDRFPSHLDAQSAYIVSALLAGRISRFVEPATPPAPRPRHALGVPPILQFWDATPPEDVRALLLATQQRNPELRHELFDAPRARAFLKVNFGDEMAALFDHCHHPAMQSDFFRLAYLFLHGGIYVDADDACQRPLAPLLDALQRTECVLYLRTEVPSYLNNSCIVARPRARVIAAALRAVSDSLREARAKGVRTDIWGATGPGALTRAATQVLRGTPAQPQGGPTPFELATEGHLATFLRTDGRLGYKKTLHGNWRTAARAAEPARRLDLPGLGAVFAQKYEPGSDWGGHSGFGSSPAHMGVYVHFVEQFIHLNRIASVTDIGCGDWQFSRFLNFGAARYTGYDVVPALIARNRLLHTREGVGFELMPDDLDSLPGGDLVLIKDVLQHLPTATVQQMLAAILPKFRYALITNSYRKAGAAPLNSEEPAGGFRPLDLTAPPFGLRGSYVLEFPTALWEVLRTLLVVRAEG